MKNVARIVVLLFYVASHCTISHAQLLSGSVNTYYPVTAVNTATNQVTLSNASGLTTGQRVLLYQAKGAVITATNTSGYGDITTLNNAGGYEFNTICTISGNNVWLVHPMLHPYDPSGLVQLVTVPSGSSITVTGTISAASWAPSTGTGGIVAIESSSAIYLDADINVSGQGFQGGALVNYAIPPFNCSWAINITDYYLSLPTNGYYTGGMKGEGIAAYITNEEYGRGKLANGGGGGNNANSGGGGGGNYGLGGNGGKRSGESTFDCHALNPGIGGAALSSFGYTVAANRIFLGGGGGSGEENNGAGTPGANGGGIIILSAPAIIGGGGRLLASGLQPVNSANTDPYQAMGDGAGGGGAGGTIILNATSITGTITADVTGGRGSNASSYVNDCTGPGGGGAGGVIWAAGTVFPSAVSPAVSGGANGVVSSTSSKTSCVGSANGATSGATGISQSGYSLPSSPASVCSPLANPALQFFTANRTGQDVLLAWALASPAMADDIQKVVIQRSTDGIHFDSLTTIPCQKEIVDYRYTDAAPDIGGALTYRLAWTNPAGERSYSRIVAVPGTPGPDTASLHLYPNPAKDRITVTVFSTTSEDAVLMLSNPLGQTLRTQLTPLHNGLNTISISLTTLPSGTYFLILESQGKHLVKAFIK